MASTRRLAIITNTGDGLLAKCPGVIEAVRSATEVQRAVADRNTQTPEDQRITFRFGINLGDVIAEPDDIYGDGVNVAARLEALAEPGGFCISRVVRDQIRDKLPYAAERNDTAMISALLDAGAKINFANRTGFTRLHHEPRPVLKKLPIYSSLGARI
jgi:class 3 adenylate cyclase